MVHKNVIYHISHYTRIIYYTSGGNTVHAKLVVKRNYGHTQCVFLCRFESKFHEIPSVDFQDGSEATFENFREGTV